MKLFASFSEAIREGAKLRPQGNGGSAAQVRFKTSCALLAGLEAITGRLQAPDGEYCVFTQAYPYLLTRAPCPMRHELCSFNDSADNRHYEQQLVTLIWHLNDQHGWTRERLADWLESEEEKLGYITVIESETPRQSGLSLTVSV